MPVAAAPEVSESDLAPEAQGRVVLDLDVLRALVGDDEETVRELLSDFLDAASHEVQELQIALQAGDRRHVAAIAHKLKSASRSIGALALGELCADLERQPADSDPRRVAPTLARFESTFCATVAQIEVHNGVFQP
jgi:HPt (histidine-containing phosphotransfer) domain-containing protein